MAGFEICSACRMVILVVISESDRDEHSQQLNFGKPVISYV